MSLRIGMVLPGLGFAGGLEKHAWDLSAALRERGHDLTLLHGKSQGRDPDRYAEPFRHVTPIDRAGAALQLDVAWVHKTSDVEEISLLGTLPLIIATHDHSLTCVHSHRYLPLTHEPCHRPPGLACIGFGCCVVRDRRLETSLPLRLGNPFGLRTRLRRLAARGLLVACSRYVASNLIRAGVPPGRVRVLHPVPPDDPFPTTAPPGDGRLVVAGQLLRGKGIELAIRALALLPDCSLDVVGEGPSLHSLQALARKSNRPVRFLGYRPPHEVRQTYDAASVVLVPSLWPEPFGMVGIEAMRRARPVAGAAHGGIPEWLEHGVGGLLFAPGSVESLAGAASALLADHSAGERACRYARARFPHGRVVQEAEALIAEVLRTGGRS
jgi:glycosyltransferase involved in cell wall biosynthesis